jgi:hypothetical protein
MPSGTVTQSSKFFSTGLKVSFSGRVLGSVGVVLPPDEFELSSSSPHAVKLEATFCDFSFQKVCFIEESLYLCSNRTRLHPIRTASESFFYLKKNLFSLN